jgi:plastocyanin
MPDEKEQSSNAGMPPANEQDMVSFAVMPHNAQDAQGGGDVRMSDINAASDRQEGAAASFFRGKTMYIVIGVVVLAALGAAAYFLLWPSSNSQTPKNEEEKTSKLPKVFLQQFFQTDSCQNTALCGDVADPDEDGLDNYNEFVEQSDPTNPDSDSDGLADGDEVNIYLTDPIKKYTDKRPSSEAGGYTDGSQIKNEYDPLTPGLKMTDVRKAQIQSAIEEFKLHEPTKTTLAAAIKAPAKSVTVFIANNKFDPSTVFINPGDTIVWLNKDSSQHQIVSGPHPEHSQLPDLASGILSTNQTYSYQFKEAGSFKYHDEMNTGAIGTVEVKP